MSKKVLNREQIRQEIRHRLLLGSPGLTGAAEVDVPMPEAHSPDVHARNWNMKELVHSECAATLREIVEEARKEFFLSDSQERNELRADSFAHG